jgi:hypothetical protein
MDLITVGGWVELGILVIVGLVIIWGIVALIDRILGKRR